nr:hypothetical protein Iba_chr04eCG19760 [Ipomoea batatas]
MKGKKPGGEMKEGAKREGEKGKHEPKEKEESQKKSSERTKQDTRPAKGSGRPGSSNDERNKQQRNRGCTKRKDDQRSNQTVNANTNGRNHQNDTKTNNKTVVLLTPCFPLHPCESGEVRRLSELEQYGRCPIRLGSDPFMALDVESLGYNNMKRPLFGTFGMPTLYSRVNMQTRAMYDPL